MAKIISFKTACRISKKLRSQGKKVVYTAGVFDVLHIGHIRFFKEMLQKGGENAVHFVGIATDGEARRKGHNRPIFPQKIRAEMVSMIGGIDNVVLLESQNPTPKIHKRIKKMIKPHMIVFGNTTEEVINQVKNESKELGFKFVHVPDKYKIFSSTTIIQKILEVFSS